MSRNYFKIFVNFFSNLESATFYTWSLSTIQFLGVFIGTTIFGSFADKFGRKPVSIFVLTFGILVLAFSSKIFCHFLKLGYLYVWWHLFVARFFVGLTTGGTMVVMYTYCMESVLTEQRMALNVYPNWVKFEKMNSLKVLQIHKLVFLKRSEAYLSPMTPSSYNLVEKFGSKILLRNFFRR